MISGNMVGSYSQIGKTFILQDENGNELVGVVTDSAMVFDATDNDVREGKLYVSDSGVSTGTKDIPAYRTTQSDYCVFSGEDYSIPLEHYNQYDYSKIQGLIAKYDPDPSKRMAVDKVIIGNNVYAANSSDILSVITKNTETKSIDLNIKNDTNDDYIVYYFTYKEE